MVWFLLPSIFLAVELLALFLVARGFASTLDVSVGDEATGRPSATSFDPFVGLGGFEEEALF